MPLTYFVYIRIFHIAEAAFDELHIVSCNVDNNTGDVATVNDVIENS